MPSFDQLVLLQAPGMVVRRVVPLLAFLAVVGCAGEGTGTENAQRSATTSTTVKEVSQPTVIAGVPADGPRLAFGDGESLIVLARDGEPVEVGDEGNSAWSSDGRYLAWSVFEPPSSSGSGEVNAPEDNVVYVLDTRTGERVRYDGSTYSLSGTVLGLDRGFAAVISGKNNLGEAATDFAILRFDELLAGIESEVVHADFALDDEESYDFAWVESRNDNLYVVVTYASGTWYRYDPVLWRVTLHGEASRLFGECDGQPEGCLSNSGFNALSVSPDERFVAFDGGSRNGCEAYPKPTLTGAAAYTPIVLDGLPATTEGGSEVVGFTSVTWTGADSFTAVVSHWRMPQGEDRCSYPEIEPDRLYRCATNGQCEATEIEAEWAAISTSGDIATVRSRGRELEPAEALVQWVEGIEDEITLGVGSGMVWSP